jgi:hypothetical protein
MGVDNLANRWRHLLAEPGTVAAQIKDVIVEAATKINDLVADTPPVLMSIIQNLEQAAHLTVSSPHLRTPAVGEAAADPTQAAPQPTADAASPTETASTSTDSSAPSIGDSTP